jgi:hypothetical protein
MEPCGGKKSVEPGKVGTKVWSVARSGIGFTRW